MQKVNVSNRLQHMLNFRLECIRNGIVLEIYSDSWVLGPVICYISLCASIRNKWAVTDICNRTWNGMRSSSWWTGHQQCYSFLQHSQSICVCRVECHLSVSNLRWEGDPEKNYFWDSTLLSAPRLFRCHCLDAFFTDNRKVFLRFFPYA